MTPGSGREGVWRERKTGKEKQPTKDVESYPLLRAAGLDVTGDSLSLCAQTFPSKGWEAPDGSAKLKA